MGFHEVIVSALPLRSIDFLRIRLRELENDSIDNAMRYWCLAVAFALLQASRAFSQLDVVCDFASLLRVPVVSYRTLESEQQAEVQELLRAQGIGYRVTVIGFRTHFDIDTCFRAESSPRIIVNYEGGKIPENPDALRSGFVADILFEQLKHVRGPVNLKKSWDEHLNGIVDRLSSGSFSHWNKKDLAQGVSVILKLRTVWIHKIAYYERHVPIENRPPYIIALLSQSEEARQEHFKDEFKKFYQYNESEMGELVDKVWSDEMAPGWEFAITGHLPPTITLEPIEDATRTVTP